jgi:hypothetical protein
LYLIRILLGVVAIICGLIIAFFFWKRFFQYQKIKSRVKKVNARVLSFDKKEIPLPYGGNKLKNTMTEYYITVELPETGENVDIVTLKFGANKVENQEFTEVYIIQDSDFNPKIMPRNVLLKCEYKLFGALSLVLFNLLSLVIILFGCFFIRFYLIRAGLI